MTLRGTTSFSVRRTLHLRASSKAHLPSCPLETGTALISESSTNFRGCGPSEIMFRSGFENFREKSLCQWIKRQFIHTRKDVALFSKYNVSSRFYHSSSCNKNSTAGLPDLTCLRYHLTTPYLIRSKYVTESQLFSTLESSPYAFLHTSKQNDIIDGVTGTPSPVLMDEEEEPALRETIDPLLWQFLNQNPFLSSSNTLKDPISYALSQCRDLSGVIAIIDSNHDEIDLGRACVAVAKLWSLDTKSETNLFFSRLVPLPSHNLLSRHPALAHLLQVIERDYLSLDDSGLVCLLTYLTNIGVPSDTPVMQKLFLHTVDRRNYLDLPTLARIFVFLRSPDLNHHVKGKFLPRIAHFLDRCSTGEELHLINMCFVQCRKLFQDSFYSKHSQKIIDLVDSGGLSSPSHTNILINTLRVTSECYNVSDYRVSINKIFRLLACLNTPFKTDELAHLNVACRTLNLHRGLMFKLHDQAARDIADCQDPVRQAQLFPCLDSKSLRKFSQSIEPVVSQMLNSPDHESHLLTVYFILLLKNFENGSLIKDFWEKMMALTEASLVECSKCSNDAFGREAALARITKRYLAFNSNLGEQYRHLQVEKRLMSLLLDEMTNGAAGVVVGRLARMASFVVAFCGPEGVPPSVIDKLEQNVDQFEIRDLFNLTNGLQKSLALNKRAQPVLVEQLMKLSCLLSTVSRRIAQSSTNLLDLSSLIRASAVYDQVFSKFSNYAVSGGINRGNPGRQLVSSVTVASSNAQSPTNDLFLMSHWNFAGHPSGSLISTSLSNASSNHRLPSHGTKNSPSWFNADLTSNHLSGDSGSMSGYFDPIFQQRTDFTQRPPGVAGQPLDSHGTVRSPREGWVGRAGVHTVDRSLSSTSSLMQLAPLLIPHTGQMSIKAAMQLSQTFAKTDFANMELLDSVLQYLAHCISDVPGRAVAQVLFAAFTLGHCSNLPHHIVTTLATVITQHVSSLHGTQLLQAALSLCLYQALSRALIASVFNVEFLDLLDEEMAASYSKPRQPQRVRQLLMEVNRGVCIDYPEARVPWFHDQYCNDFIQTASHPRNGFRFEMQSCLSSLLGGEDVFSTNTYSPYFYPLDFTFELDSQGNALEVEPWSPLQPRTAATVSPTPPGHTRFCVLLMNHRHYSVLQLPSSTGFRQAYQLKGRQQLMQRHLEVLGYRVITVPRYEWQSMALATPDSKRNYLRRMIWSNESRT